jgi:Xaa-Pro aminopeptidase
MHSFEKAEYDIRVDRVRGRMASQGFDLLITCNPANMNYLTGYDGWSFYTPQMVAVGLNESEPICIVRGIDRPGGFVTTHLSEENMLGYPDIRWTGSEICWSNAGLARDVSPLIWTPIIIPPAPMRH